MARTDDDFNKWGRRRKGGKFQNEKGMRGHRKPKYKGERSVAAFCLRVNRLEIRAKDLPFADTFLVPLNELIAVRDYIERPTLFDLEK